MELTQARLKHFLEYNQETGIFTCKNKIFRGFSKVGDQVGSTNGRYLYTTIHGKKYALHRLVFFYTYGSLPDNDVDHINHDTFDNRLCNLRKVTKQDNQRNRSIDRRNTSGFNGVNWCKRQEQWRARISINRLDKHLGHFDKLSDAVAARKAANIKYGFHENHGKYPRQK